MPKSSVRDIDIRSELQLVKKLSHLSKISWSPTLRANSRLFAMRERQLRASELASAKRAS